MMISFSGIFYYLGLILKHFKFFKIISIDSEILVDQKKGFNFWLTGTIHKIPDEFKKLNNNYVNMKNIFHEHDKIFQLFPIIKKKTSRKKNLKIINLSSCIPKRPELSNEIWKKYNSLIKKNFLFFDEKIFWESNEFTNHDHLKNFLIYRDLKLNLRLLIVNQIMIRFKEKFLLIGNDWSNYFQDNIRSIEDKNKIKELYRGNICLDFGSISGSLSLYPRSIDIIENGGYLMQLKQSDSHRIFGKYENYYTYTNADDLKNKLTQLFDDKDLFDKRTKILSNLFKDSKRLIEKQLDNIL